MQKSLKRPQIFIICTFLNVMLHLFCYDFEFIDQPDLTAINSTFRVVITISVEEDAQGGIPHFGVLLPQGWTANDSISYSGVHTGTFIYSDTMSDSIENAGPAPNGYYWWVCVGDTADSLIAGQVTFTLQVYTDNQTGTFFIDYILGDNNGGGFPSRCRSNNHPISVGIPTMVTVTNTNDNGPGSLRQALRDISSSGEILFDLLYPDSIILDSQLVIDRNVTVSGPLTEKLTISGNNNDRVFYIRENLNVRIYNLTLSDGSPGGSNPDGGAIFCENSSLYLENVSIKNNTARNGGGIWIIGNCSLNNVTIKNNRAENGGGIFGGRIELRNVMIAGNSARNDGGGINVQSDISFNNIERSNVYLNSAVAGNDLFSSSNNKIEIAVDTFTVLEPSGYQVWPIEKFTFDILYAKVEQVSSNLYVHPYGDDNNSGLSPAEPLKTLFYAINRILADSISQHSIYLAGGLYSPNVTGELYPIRVPPYVSLSGDSVGGVTLDAENHGNVLILEQNPAAVIEKISLRNGLIGILCKDSKVKFRDLCISENDEAGIQCENSNVVLSNVTLCKNDRGVLCDYSSSVKLVNTIVWFNNQEIEVLSGEVYAFFSDIRGSYPGLSNIFDNPLFADTATGNYRLQAGSPCIDTGTAFYTYNGDTLISLQPWQYNGPRPDMGAFESGPALGIKAETDIPTVYELSQNFPNPFNPTTTIKFDLPMMSKVSLKIFDVLGEEVATLVSDRLNAGSYSIDWDASKLASGMYMYRLIAGDYVETRKMVLMK